MAILLPEPDFLWILATRVSTLLPLLLIILCMWLPLPSLLQNERRTSTSTALSDVTPNSMLLSLDMPSLVHPESSMVAELRAKKSLAQHVGVPSPNIVDMTPIGDGLAGNSHQLIPDNMGTDLSPTIHQHDVSFPPLSRSVSSSQGILRMGDAIMVDATLIMSTPLPTGVDHVLYTPTNGSCVTSNVARQTCNSIPIFGSYFAPPPSGSAALVHSM